MGSLFLAGWVMTIPHGTAARAQEGSPSSAPTTILPPSAPGRAPVTAPPRTGQEKDPFSPVLKRRQERIDKTNAANAETRTEPLSVARQFEKLQKERGEGSPATSFLALTPVYARVTTSGAERKNYHAEMTSLFHWATRVNASKKTAKTQVFSGLRLAPFTGTGIHQGVPGRYGFTYFGPMIGVGKISPPGDDESGTTAPSAGDQPESAAGFRSGWLWMTGVALTTRVADTGGMPPKGEFVNKSVLVDGTGLWTEVSYEALFYETLALRGLVGVQTGKDKVFTYGGVGVGLWM